ncbi:50S ribosomal protein L21 [soil metagenome]|jgi:large subunit ribosomal protein L21
MFAIVQSGGKQYRVQEGDLVRLELLPAEPGETVELPVMMLGGDGVANGIEVGKPLVSGVSVQAEVVGHGRGEKIYIYKFKAKANYRRKTGHRQSYTEVRIKGIDNKANGAKIIDETIGDATVSSPVVNAPVING